MVGSERTLDDRPALRPVEFTHVENDGERYVVLRDPADPDMSPIALSDGAVEVLALLDGKRSVDDIAAALALRGKTLSASEVRAFLEQLDAAGFIEGRRARDRQDRRLLAYRQRPVRVAVHAGGAYPGDVAELPRFLAAGYTHPAGPGRLPRPRDPCIPPPRGLIAPHIDLHRGAHTYSWGYAALAEARPADLYVVLGTCHTPVEGSFAATRKPYDTPLGAIPSDVGFIERLQSLWGRDLLAGELSHQGEHSIEFQAVYLRSLRLAGEGAAPIVPILCDSLHALVMPPYGPRDVALVADFVDALGRAIAEDGRSVTVVAAVDLAHVGPRFGDAWRVDKAQQARMDREDHELLSLALSGDAESYFRHVMRDGDARRICGFTPIYLLAALMSGGPPGDLLRYSQWVASDLSSSVTFASAVYR